MRIAVNTRVLLKGKLEGIGWFTHEVMKRMVLNHPEHEFIFIFDRPYDSSFVFADNVKPVVVGPQARHASLWYWWFEYSIPKVLKNEGADIFVSPEMYLSLRAKIPSLFTIHDLSILHYPEYVSWTVRQYFKRFYPKFVKKANRIATVSGYSKKDIMEQFGVSGDKIDVVYNGAHKEYEPMNAAEQKITREMHSEGKEYYLYVGALHPRKNIVRLLLAFDAFKEESQSEKLLLIAGRNAWMNKDMEETYEGMKYKEDVLFLGYQSLSNLSRITGSAYSLAYVSLFEGFGIPIIEAMNCHVPSITSNITSMPEVAGDSAILVDPFEMESIKNGLLKMENAEFRNQLSEICRKRKHEFSWDQTAAKFWESIKQLTEVSF